MSKAPRRAGDIFFLLVFAVMIVGATLLLASTVVPGAGGKSNLPLLADWLLNVLNWNAVAAIIQAIAAIAVVAVTVQLSRTARQALETSEKQVEVAQQASLLGRRDRHISEAPSLDIGIPMLIRQPEGNPQLGISVRLRSASAASALYVQIEVSTGDASGLATEPPRITKQCGDLTAIGAYEDVLLDMYPFRNVRDPRVPRPEGDPFAVNHIVVACTYQGVLGQRVTDVYLWSANHPNQNDDGVWDMTERVVAPEIEGAQPLGMRFR